MSKGAPRGRRPVVWVCSGLTGSAVLGEKLKCEKFIITDMDMESKHGKFPKKAAIEQFEEKFGCAPEFVLGPFYDKKGAKKRKRPVVDRKTKDIKLASDQKNASLGGWYGLVNMLDDNSKGFFIFLRELKPNPKRKKDIPEPGIVNIDDLVFN